VVDGDVLDSDAEWPAHEPIALGQVLANCL
jgi:hypothetical protein